MSDWNPKANDIFLAALDFEDREERNSFIAQRCAGNEPLRREIESLLADASKAGSFLDQPALGDPAHGFDSPTLPRAVDQAQRNKDSIFDPVRSASGGEETANAASQFIGPYKLLQRIGEGGMGEVWMAEQEKLMKDDPASETNYDALHAAYDKWRNQIADGEKPANKVITKEPVATQKAIEQSDLETPPSPDSNPPFAPDDLLAPTVREMLALPRGSEKFD